MSMAKSMLGSAVSKAAAAASEEMSLLMGVQKEIWYVRCYSPPLVAVPSAGSCLATWLQGVRSSQASRLVVGSQTSCFALLASFSLAVRARQISAPRPSPQHRPRRFSCSLAQALVQRRKAAAATDAIYVLIFFGLTLYWYCRVCSS